ncbi:MAG: hypothetical protein CVV64_10495 [Candidatus Wallbacteria bacterium HGW-Wallbacteria-1]|uniref:Uncharacterized protein n=1 Tax=Candidatus Wallbacteria bacterium HGW-Wallbacteria-1 TaxID=2013854 RepID=A0A2N1PP91_9BACT|nr:MAG: hypothetical protein CVV64_10495 [Candidatus Wallbacteria bacterium HGW-Wallbacteria-1]
MLPESFEELLALANDEEADVDGRKDAIMALAASGRDEARECFRTLLDSRHTPIRYYARRAINTMGTTSGIRAAVPVPDSGISGQSDQISPHGSDASETSMDLIEPLSPIADTVSDSSSTASIPEAMASGISSESSPSEKVNEPAGGDSGRSDSFLERVKALGREKDPFRICSHITNLSETGDTSLLPILERLLTHESPRVRASVIEAFEKVANPETATLVIPYLKDDDNRVKGNAAKFLWMSCPERVIEEIQNMLSSNLEWEEASALYVLSCIETSRKSELLAMALTSSSQEIRDKASLLLDKEKSRSERSSRLMRAFLDGSDSDASKGEDGHAEPASAAAPLLSNQSFQSGSVTSSRHSRSGRSKSDISRDSKPSGKSSSTRVPAWVYAAAIMLILIPAAVFGPWDIQGMVADAVKVGRSKLIAMKSNSSRPDGADKVTVSSLVQKQPLESESSSASSKSGVSVVRGGAVSGSAEEKEAPEAALAANVGKSGEGSESIAESDSVGVSAESGAGDSVNGASGYQATGFGLGIEGSALPADVVEGRRAAREMIRARKSAGITMMMNLARNLDGSFSFTAGDMLYEAARGAYDLGKPGEAFNLYLESITFNRTIGQRDDGGIIDTYSAMISNEKDKKIRDMGFALLSWFTLPILQSRDACKKILAVTSSDQGYLLRRVLEMIEKDISLVQVKAPVSAQEVSRGALSVNSKGSKRVEPAALSEKVIARMAEARKLLRIGEGEKATAIGREILGQAPDSPDAHVLMGEITMETGRSDEAVQSLERASRLSGGKNADILYRLSEAYIGAGNKGRAKKSLGMVLFCDPDSEIGDLARNRILELEGLK